MNELEITPDSTELPIDEAFLKNMIKSEIAGAKWGKDMQWSIRLMKDNQIIEALQYFEQAEEFFNFNIVGAFVGEQTPIYVYKSDRQEIDEIAEMDDDG